jgi:hypothetical protein
MPEYASAIGDSEPLTRGNLPNKVNDLPDTVKSVNERPEPLRSQSYSRL